MSRLVCADYGTFAELSARYPHSSILDEGATGDEERRDIAASNFRRKRRDIWRKELRKRFVGIVDSKR